MNANYTTLSVRDDAGIRIVTIEREGAGNSLSLETAQEIEAVLVRTAADHEATALIVTGRGERFFSAGGDVRGYRELQTGADALRMADTNARLFSRIESVPFPVIAAINGYALGAGCDLALACDLRVAGTNARLGMWHVRVGMIAGWNSWHRLVSDVGRARATELLMTGNEVSATRAYEIGLVNRVADGSPLPAALELAASLRNSGPLAIAAVKQLLRDDAWQTRDEREALNRRLFADLWTTEDHREAEAAFERRVKPMFRGR